MTGVYRLAKGWRIFIYIFGTLLIGVFIFMCVMPFTLDDLSPLSALFFIPVSVGMIALFTYGLIDAYKGKLIIEQDRIISVGARHTRILLFDEIKGYRSDDKYIYIIPIDAEKKKIKISTYIQKSAYIDAWLHAKFGNIDENESFIEEQKILESDEFGITRESREHRLNEVKRICKVANAIGFALFFWIAFYPKPYIMSLSLGLLYPGLMLILLFFYRGMVRMDERRNSAYPSLYMGFVMASLGLILRAMLDFNILDYNGLWVAVTIATIGLFIIITIGAKKISFEKAEGYFAIFGNLIVAFCCSFGIYVIANCMYDNSLPELFESTVINKEISSGKTTTYYLIVEPWGNLTENEKVKVSEDEYKIISIGGEVTVYQMEGLFKTPWYNVSME